MAPLSLRFHLENFLAVAVEKVSQQVQMLLELVQVVHRLLLPDLADGRPDPTGLGPIS
jgi:hypothetical protein